MAELKALLRCFDRFGSLRKLLAVVAPVLPVAKPTLKGDADIDDEDDWAAGL